MMALTTADKLALKCVELEKLFAEVDLIKAERDVLMALLTLENFKRQEDMKL